MGEQTLLEQHSYVQETKTTEGKLQLIWNTIMTSLFLSMLSRKIFLRMPINATLHLGNRSPVTPVCIIASKMGTTAKKNGNILSKTSATSLSSNKDNAETRGSHKSKQSNGEVRRKHSTSSLSKEGSGMKDNTSKSTEKIGKYQSKPSHRNEGEEGRLTSKALSDNKDYGISHHSPKLEEIVLADEAQAAIISEYDQTPILSQFDDGNQIDINNDSMQTPNVVGMGTTDLLGVIGTVQQDFLEVPKSPPSAHRSDISGSEMHLVENKTLTKVDGWKFKLLIGLFIAWFSVFIVLCLIVGIYSLMASRNKTVNEENRNTSAHFVQDIEQFKQIQESALDRISEMTNSTKLSIESLSDEIQQQLAAVESEFQPSHQFFTKVTNIGLSEETAINSCGDLPSNFPSGFYFIKSSDGAVAHLFCNMTFSCNGVVGGWTQVVDFDSLTDSCYSELVPRPSLRGCRSPVLGCSSITLSTSNIDYSRVCGRIIAFQIGHVNGFSGRAENLRSIEHNYVDGISLTRGRPREHIWTFVAARDDAISSNDGDFACPCLESRSGNPSGIPAFVNEDYFCDTASTSPSVASGQEFPDNPLWDGEGCSGNNECCEFNRPPYFYKALPHSSSEDIEMRVCIDEDQGHENIAIRRIELFVR